MTWNPQPEDNWTTRQKAAYHAGYSDRWHGHPYGSGDEETGIYPMYRTGWEKAAEDRKNIDRRETI